MITSLRTKVRPDTLRTQVRSGGKSVGRRIYFAAILVLLSFLLYYSIGGYFLLEVEGTVASERTEVAPMSLSRVIDVKVRPTQSVKAGDLLLTVQAPDVLMQLGQAQYRLSEIMRRDDQIRSRLASIDTLKPLASSYSARASKFDSTASAAGTKGFASSSHLAGTARDSYNAARDFSLLATEEQALRDEMATQSKLRGEASALISGLEAIYQNGHIYAPLDGTVGGVVPDEGQIFEPAQSMLAINTGEPFVLAYVPTARTYSIDNGRSVIVTDGANRVLGHVQRLRNQNAIAAAVPKDLQSTFRTPAVREVFRVNLNSASPFPLFAKVNVVDQASPSNVTALILRSIRGLLLRFGPTQEPFEGAARTKPVG